MKKVIYILIFMCVIVGNISAQFGKNRVSYYYNDWYYIQTKHFDIYFSLDGKIPTEFAASILEEFLNELQTKLKYKINNRVPVIVYNSHNEFQETNTVDEYLSQGIGGFTEPFKNRIVVPFEGDYSKFRHVIRHEMVHAFLQDMLYGGTIQNVISKGITLQLPLWYHEGMAEYMSSGWDTYSDMFISDALINEYLPDINYLSGYYAYRGGQSLFRYISEKYGEQKIAEILDKIRGVGNLEEAIKASIGLNIEELNDRWKKELKKEYFPEIADRQDPDDFAQRLTDHKKIIGFYNTSPSLSPQGDKIAFISDRDIYLDVYILDARNGKVLDKLVSSGRTNDFEELNVLFPSLTWAPDNKRVALSGKSSGYDVINVIHTETGDKYELPFKMKGIESVSWSPDGNKISFNGHNLNQSDIYVYDFETKELQNLTDDIFTDSYPSWSSDNSKIFFSSDRGSFTDKSLIPDGFSMSEHYYNQTDIYSYDFNTKSISRLTNWEDSDERFAISSANDDEIIFVSDKNGIDNLYKIKIDKEKTVNVDSTNPQPITNSLYGITQISTSGDRKKLAFTSLFKGGYNIFLMDNPFELKPIGDKLEETQYVLNRNKIKYGYSEDSNYVILDSMSIYPDSNSTTTTDTSKSKTKIFTGQYRDDDQTIDDSTQKIDYTHYIFGKEKFPVDTSLENEEKKNLFNEKLDNNGNYIVNKYIIDFSPDLIYANAGYSSLYGLLGTTVLSFSDMLGNHRIVGITSLQIDLKNSDYGVAYYYLRNRIDFGIEGFHTARFLYLERNGYSNLYRFRNYGAVLSASLPIDRFYRFDASISNLFVSAENLDDYTIPNENTTFIIPSLSFVHDNVMWGYTSPIQGTRYNLTIFGNPGIDKSRRAFFSVLWDYRKYFRFFYDNSFAIRLSGGYSMGGNPQRFFLGGTESWINYKFASGYIPLEDAADFAFMTPALPLRGYDYAQQIGTKYSLLNLEFRLPVVRYLLTGPLPLLFQNILGTIFLDVGTAWEKNNELQLFKKTGAGNLATNDLLIGTGYGFRIYFLFFLLRFDVAWSYDFISTSAPKYYFSIGADF